MRKGNKEKAQNTKQNCRINSLVSSQSEIDLNVSCDAQNSEPPGNKRKNTKLKRKQTKCMQIFVWNEPLLWNSVYPQSLRRLVLELDLSASIAEVDQQAQDEYQQQQQASDPAGRDIGSSILVSPTGILQQCQIQQAPEKIPSPQTNLQLSICLFCCFPFQQIELMCYDTF